MTTFNFRVKWIAGTEVETQELEVIAASDQTAWDLAWIWYRKERDSRMEAVETHHGTLHLVGIKEG